MWGREGQSNKLGWCAEVCDLVHVAFALLLTWCHTDSGSSAGQTGLCFVNAYQCLSILPLQLRLSMRRRD